MTAFVLFLHVVGWGTLILLVAPQHLDVGSGGVFRWAFSKPVRKVYYNLTITALSVAVALLIGTIELVSVLTEKLSISSGPLAMIGSVDLNYVGYGIVVFFVGSWVLALAVWRLGRVEERWTAHLVPSEAGEPLTRR
jgi:nickel/cobalt transporter (NiCoT) family protein